MDENDDWSNTDLPEIDCHTCTSILDQAITITIIDSPIASAVDNGDGTISAAGTGDYQWVDCSTNTAIDGENSDVFAPTENGQYQVVVSDGTCSDTSDCVTIDYLSLSKNENSGLIAYPNPTDGLFTVSLENGLISHVFVTDASGRLVFSEQIESDETEIDLSGMQNGVYFVEIENKDNLRSRIKIIKN